MADSLTGAGASLEAPTMVTAAGGTPVMAIVENVTTTFAQMRSVNRFDVGTNVEFGIVLRGAPPIAVRGSIRSCTQNGPRFHYDVTLHATPDESAAIERAVRSAQARASGRVADVPTGNGLTRSSIRVPVDFRLRYTVAGGATFDASATNISTGGILLNAREELAVGTSLELRFLLGSTPVEVRGRIVAHQVESPNYNIAFYDVRDDVKEALARFVNSASA
jgi:PilZ domain